uniref:Uncharacterized protein n=1 Tax=Micrurus corallinus TaxID=54390 RepID=A0A2D4G8I4_MICCO
MVFLHYFFIIILSWCKIEKNKASEEMRKGKKGEEKCGRKEAPAPQASQESRTKPNTPPLLCSRCRFRRSTPLTWCTASLGFAWTGPSGAMGSMGWTCRARARQWWHV